MIALQFFTNFYVRAKWAFLTLGVGSLFFFGLLGAGSPMAYGQSQQVFSLVWSDEFNSVTSSNVDSTKWTFDVGNNNGWGNNELEIYTSNNLNNAYVAGGLLHIHAQVENTNPITISSARLKTQSKFAFLYGRVEWRAKLPAGVGMWPALWMMGTNIVKDPWPKCGEIDVVENNGASPNFVQGSIHTGATDATQVYSSLSDGTVTNFHVYDLDWSTNSLTWSVDGVAYETQTSWASSSGKPYPAPFNLGFFLLMNLATGGDYVGDPDTNSVLASLPNEMQIDYVRVFQTITVLTPLITSISPTNGCASGGTPITVSGVNFRSGGTITMNGVSATSYTFVNSNTLTAVTGPNPSGLYNVIVKTPTLPPTTLTNGFTYASAPVFGGPTSVTPVIEGATLSWSAASGGTAPIAYNVYEGTNSGGETGPVLTTNALSAFLPLFPGSNSPITYFLTVNAVDSCSASDTNQVELSVQPLLDPDASQVGDGIPNSWKEQYGFNPFDPTVASADPDGDGLSNLQEFLLGTDPTDPTSPFHVTGVTMNGPDMIVNWMSVGGMTNAVESTTDLTQTYSNISANIILTGNGLTTTNYTDPGAATNNPATYYRVRLIP